MTQSWHFEAGWKVLKFGLRHSQRNRIKAAN